MTPRSTLRVRVIGQRSRSQGQKMSFQVIFDRLALNVWGQGSHKSRSKVTWVKSKVDLYGQVKCQGHQVKNSHLTILQVMFEVKGHTGQGQRSHGWRANVTWVKPSLKVIILAGGLTSTSSCIFYIYFFFSIRPFMDRRLVLEWPGQCSWFWFSL